MKVGLSPGTGDLLGRAAPKRKNATRNNLFRDIGFRDLGFRV